MGKSYLINSTWTCPTLQTYDQYYLIENLQRETISIESIDSVMKAANITETS